MKKFISIVLSFAMLVSMFMTTPIISSAETPPVWKIAFISLPSYLDTYGEYWEKEESVEKAFFEAADKLENWMETITEYPLDIQIVKISTDYKMDAQESTIYSPNGIADVNRYEFNPEAYSAYNLDEYDTIVWGVPRSRHKEYMRGSCGPYDIDVGLVNSADVSAQLFGTIRHEFVHSTEWWHRKYLRYQLPIKLKPTELSGGGYRYDWYYDEKAPVPTVALPYDIATGYHDIWGTTASHNIDFYGYSDKAENFYSDWMNNRIADPLFGEPGHTLKYLGMTEEMWRQGTPSSLGFPEMPSSNDGYIDYYDDDYGTDDFNDTGWDTSLSNDTAAYRVRSTSVKNAYIDLKNETFILPSGYTVAAYSINGGVNWKALSDGNISKINLSSSVLLKTSNIVLTNSYDAKAKSPTSDASVIIFPTIHARPKTNSQGLKPNYGIEVSSDGEAIGSWVLSVNGKGNESVYEGYEIAKSSNGKTPDDEWQKMPSEGISVLPYTQKAFTWLVRSAPVVNFKTGEYIAASKTWKIKPVVQKKPTIVRANYVKETISLKKGMAISWNGEVYIAENSEQYSITKILDATSNGEAQTIRLWMAADEKRPASAQQVYKLAMRATLLPGELEVSKGKIVPGEKLEFLNPAKGTWGSVPSFTSTQTVSEGVRLKSTVKADGKDDTDYFAKSLPLDLSVTYGEYQSGNSTKQGVVKAEITSGTEE